MRRRRAERGSLVTTLFVISFIAVVAFSLALMSYQHWLHASRAHSRLMARTLAESAATQATARLVGESGFTTDDTLASVFAATPPDRPPLTAQQAVEMLAQDAGGGSGIGYVCFAPSVATRYGLAHVSKHNATDASIEFRGARIPGQCARIVAHGACNGETYDLLTLVYVPPFPMAIISSGPLDSTGGLVVTGVRNANDFTGAVEDIPSNRRAKITVASNSNDAQAADIGPGATVYGTLQAVGGIRVAAGSEVKGSVLPRSQPVELPDFSYETLRERIAPSNIRNIEQDPSTFGLPISGMVSDFTVDWLYRGSGNLYVSGNVTLDGGVLLVDGDLRVSGSVQGNGCIVVSGSTTIERGATLSTDNMVALVSRGPITLRGQDRKRSFIQGVVYSEARIDATHLTIVGSILTRSSSEGDGAMRLHDVNVVCSPTSARAVVGLPFRTSADDDTTHLMASFLVDADDPTRVSWTGTAIPIKWDIGAMTAFPDVGAKRTWKGITRDELKRRYVELDAAYVHDGANGGNIANRGRAGEIDTYLDAVQRGSDANQTILSFDLNKLLTVVSRYRVLLWRPL